MITLQVVPDLRSVAHLVRLCLILLLLDYGNAIFRKPNQHRSSFNNGLFEPTSLNAVNTNTNQIFSPRDVSNGTPCSRYSTQGALLNRLRMRASFNPTIMSSSLEEADSKIRDLLGSPSYVAAPLGRSAFGGLISTASQATRLIQDQEYFTRANALASQELIKNNELALRKICWARPLVRAVPVNMTRFQTRFRRDLQDTAKVAELDQIGVTRRQYCLNRGDDRNGLLRMCKMCAAVTELPENYFPRYINEVMCSSDDTGCLYAGSLPHGICQAKKLEITLLERYTNHDCLEDWQPVTVEARVSCECFVHRSSFLRPFV